MQDLLAENRALKQAITNLSGENQIGYAKVIAQETKDGELFTTLRFVETGRNDKLKKILEKEFTIAGDVIHFDALIVKFGNKMVMDGRTRALYLWRRVYGEQMTPREGFAIEEPGTEPQRYSDLLRKLGSTNRVDLFTRVDVRFAAELREVRRNGRVVLGRVGKCRPGQLAPQLGRRRAVGLNLLQDSLIL